MAMDWGALQQASHARGGQGPAPTDILWYRFEQIPRTAWQSQNGTMALLLHTIMTDCCGFTMHNSDKQCKFNDTQYDFRYMRAGYPNIFQMSLFFRRGRVVLQTKELGNERNVRQLGLSVDKYLVGANPELIRQATEPPMSDLIAWIEKEVTQPLVAKCFIGKVDTADTSAVASQQAHWLGNSSVGSAELTVGVGALLACALVYYCVRGTRSRQ
jgi:hypothetical protein